MRIGILIVSSLLLQALFALSVHSQDDYDFTDAARAERSSWALKSNAKIIDMPIGSKTSPGSSNSGQSGREVQSQNETPKTIISNDTAPKQIQPARVSGNWFIKIGNNASRNATLKLFQSGDVVFGKGEIMDDSSTLAAVASGSVAGDELDLDLIATEELELFRLSMIVNGNSTIGSFTAFSPNASSFTGTSRGLRYNSSS